MTVAQDTPDAANQIICDRWTKQNRERNEHVQNPKPDQYITNLLYYCSCYDVGRDTVVRNLPGPHVVYHYGMINFEFLEAKQYLETKWKSDWRGRALISIRILIATFLYETMILDSTRPTWILKLCYIMFILQKWNYRIDN